MKDKSNQIKFSPLKLEWGGFRLDSWSFLLSVQFRWSQRIWKGLENHSNHWWSSLSFKISWIFSLKGIFLYGDSKSSLYVSLYLTGNWKRLLEVRLLNNMWLLGSTFWQFVTLRKFQRMKWISAPLRSCNLCF